MRQSRRITKPFVILVHRVEDGRSHVVKRMRFATRADADEALEALIPTLPKNEQADLHAPMWTEQI